MLTGLVAAVLLLAGGLTALKTLCIVAAFPFMLIMVGACGGLMKELRKEPLVAGLDQHVLAGVRRDSGYVPAGNGNGVTTEIASPATAEADTLVADTANSDNPGTVTSKAKAVPAEES